MPAIADVRIGLIAPGGIARRALAPAIAAVDGAVLWSVLSRDAGRAADFAQRHGARSPSPAYADLGAMLADPELDAVLIASPDKLHAQHCITAARAGKHVLCEKPMATEIDDAWAMVAACHEAGVKLGVAYHMRWHAGHREMAAAVHAGSIGAIRHMRAQWSFKAADDSNWRAAADVGRWWGLAGVGTHCLDQIRWYMSPSSGEIVRVTPLIARAVFKGPHDETAVVAMQFESGATAEIVTSVLFDAPRRMEAYGSDGYVLFDDTFGPHGGGRIVTQAGEHAFRPCDPYEGEIRDFVEAIRDDRAPEVTGEEGARNVEILVAAVS